MPMRNHRVAPALLPCTLALALVACATQGTSPPPVTAAAEADHSAYGLFLAGSAAQIAGDMGGAADKFDAAAKVEGDAPFLKERAFTAALVSGDVHRAASLAPQLGDKSPSLQ